MEKLVPLDDNGKRFLSIYYKTKEMFMEEGVTNQRRFMIILPIL